MTPNFRWIPVLLIVTGCNSYKSKLAPAPAMTPVSLEAVSYDLVQSQIFTPHCIHCHSAAGHNKGDVNLETYANILSNLSDVQKDVLVAQKMPPKSYGGPLSGDLQTLLKTWIQAGAPEVAGGAPAPIPAPTPVASPSPSPSPSPTVSPSPSPSPVPDPAPAPVPNPGPNPGPDPAPPVPAPAPNPGPDPAPPAPVPPAPVPVPDPAPAPVVQPTWSSISSLIFQPVCVKCHVAGGKAEDDPLTDQSYVADPKNQLVVPGHPEQSALIHALTRTDTKRMPPAKAGYGPLPDQQIQAIQTWILNGAKD